MLTNSVATSLEEMSAALTGASGQYAMFRLFTPHLRVESVAELTPQRLRAMGLDSLLLDVDCTLARYSTCEVSPEVAAWLCRVRQAGMGLCLLSNGIGGRIGQFAERLRLPFVAGACKPLPWGCWAALRKMGFQADRTALVGDQVFADVMAARLAHLTAILVRPIHPEDEPWFTRLKRRPEQFVLWCQR